MKILAIETSSLKLSVAVAENYKIMASLSSKSERGHCAYLIPLLDKLLKKANLPLNKIDILAINLGPGSFTGLRIGVSTIKGLASAIKKKIVGVSGLDVLAHNALGEKEDFVCPIIDAKKNKIYAALYQKNGNGFKKYSGDLLIPIQDLLKIINKPTLFLGDGIRIYREEISRKLGAKARFADGKLWYPQAKIVARLAEKLAKKKKFINPLDLVPLYLHKRDCQIRK